MITLEDCKQAGSYNYKGMSTDTKPTNCAVNSLFLELDTGIFYYFNGTEWEDINKKITLGEDPTGTITITNNGIFDVHNYAEADVDVPAITPTGTMSITENGTYDVANYAEASVDVDATVNFNLPALTRSIPTELSQARNRLAATTVGNYALLGGGYGSSLSAVVDAYDTSLTRSTPTVLSQARDNLAATTIAPAGGSSPQSGYALFGGGSSSNVVDAYDTSLTRTTPTALSQSRSYLAATTVGNYALFGGGLFSNVVDAYDASLTRSTPTVLSQARDGLAATTIAPAGGYSPQSGYALFGGGSSSNVVDAYDTSLTRTTPTALSQARYNLAATTIGDYALFGGGVYGNNTYYAVVDAYDTSLTRTTPTALSQARGNLAATTIAPAGGSSPQSGYALFGGGDGNGYYAVVDAYDQNLTRSTPTELSQTRNYLAATTVAPAGGSSPQSGYALFGGGHGDGYYAVIDAYSASSYDIQVFPGTKYSFNGSAEQTSSTWQTISMQGEVIGYITVKDATIN